MRGASLLGILALLAFGLFPTVTVIANVPTVIELQLETRGEETVLIIQARHSSPSQSHYVDIVEVDIDGAVEELEMDPQSGTTFTVEHAVDPRAVDIRARAHCTTHGWSLWESLEAEEPSGTGGGIPGFPVESAAVGMAVGAILLWAARRR